MKCNKEKISTLVMKASASNRFTLLNELVGDGDLLPSVEERKSIDEYMNKEDEEDNIDSQGLSKEMKRYYKDKNELFDAANEMEIEEDVEEVIQNLEEEFGVMDEDSIDLVYASNSYIDRRKLWRDLRAQKSITNGDPWVIIGDFNVSLKVEEHSNGSFALSNEMNEFLDCTREIEVEDILSSGLHFTWTKSRGNPKCKTLKKLDRIMINKAFMEKFPSSHGIFLPYLISDYSPVVPKLPNGMEKRRKAFRFSNFVTDKKEFLPTIKKAWETEIDGHMMYKVVKKLKLMKHSLNNLSWENGNIFERVSKLKDCLKESQAEVDRYPHDDTIKAKSCKVLQEYYEALNEENSLLMQKAKIEWLKDGDRNTKFFHKIIKGRMHKGRIMSVCNEKRERFENEKVAEQFVKHFQEFLGKKDLVMEFPADRIVFPNKLSSDEVDRISRSISEVEVKNSMFDIDDSKAPGPDGFTARFFKSTWSIIGKDVSKAIQEFFITGKLLGEVNATLISLVPKIQNPD
ncbi:RNA-directed DNA polymerase, eukaryota, reverse transcriptase zinc-binding domain protein, partial [Tanacetum coccineum]